MVVVFLGYKKNRFEYETIDELIVEAKKYSVSIGNDVSIGYDVSIGNGVSILTRAKIPNNFKIDRIYHLVNEYKYSVSGYGNMIQLGCFTRTIEEWDADFWNNDNEFPEKSEAGQLRLKAYNKMKTLLAL